MSVAPRLVRARARATTTGTNETKQRPRMRSLDRVQSLHSSVRYDHYFIFEASLQEMVGNRLLRIQLFNRCSTNGGLLHYSACN